jgi:PAS domain S-box-containing protein
MSWVTITWSMTAAACLTLAVMHLRIWFRKRAAWANLLFSLTAMATTGAAFCELWMMHAVTPDEFGRALRWMHVPVWALTLSLVGFTRFYLRAGRPWLAWTVCGVRTLSLILNFIFTPNLNYREITALRPIRFLDEFVPVAEGVLNPWMLVGQASLFLLLVFVVDAAVTVWRRREHSRARLLAGAIVFFVVAAAGQAMLALWGIVHMPITATLFFSGVVAAMGLELSDGVLSAAHLADELRESEARFRTVADTAPVLIWMAGTDKLCNFFNQGWLDFTGRRLEQELGNGWIEGIHPDDLAACLKTYTECFEARRSFSMEYRLRRHDGEYRWLSDHGVPRYDSDRNFLGYIGSCVDLTERKLAEAEALRQRAELTHVARLSTMGALASSLAHELNQPLSAILSNAQAGSRFLAATPPDLAEVRGALADIAQDTKRAGEVIRQLRALVKRDETHLQPLNLNGVITEVVQLVHSDMLIRNASIALELDRALPLVSGDTVQLQQVLLNLLLNAFDSMAEVPEGRRTAVLRTRRWDASSIRVEVCDCGTGISPERLVNLFERFRSSKRDGLGLGLSISHSIVEAHRGRLWAENNHDRGATFYFTLPVQEAELDLR